MKPNETDPLLKEAAATTNAGFSTHDSIAKTWINLPRPFSWFCQSATDRVFKARIRQGQYKTSTPTIAFRGSLTPPGIIFTQGMNAYSRSSAPSNVNLENLTLSQKLLGVCCLPCSLPVLATFYAIACSLSYCVPTCSLSSPGNYCGQNSIVGPHVSNWSVLAFSKKFELAIPYLNNPNENSYFRYIVVLPNGSIDLGQFSRDLYAEGILKEPTQEERQALERNGGAFAHDTEEIIPNGEQRIYPEDIVAAVKETDGHLFYIFNPASKDYDEITAQHFTHTSPPITEMLAMLNTKLIVKQPTPLKMMV